MAFRDSDTNITPLTVVEASATNVSYSGVAKTITSILLTPGTYVIVGQMTAVNTGLNLIGANFSISTVNNTIQGAYADQKMYQSDPEGSLHIAITINNYRVVVASNTTYYIVGEPVAFSGTTTLNGRITALKVA